MSFHTSLATFIYVYHFISLLQINTTIGMIYYKKKNNSLTLSNVRLNFIIIYDK